MVPDPLTSEDIRPIPTQPVAENISRITRLLQRVPLPPVVLQAIVYGTVGIIATAADWGLFFLASDLISWHYTAAVVVGKIGGIVANYFLNKTVTFRNSVDQLHWQIGAYLLVVVISLALTELLMFTQVELLHWHPTKLCYVITTLVMFPINFLMLRYIVFNKKLIR